MYVVKFSPTDRLHTVGYNEPHVERGSNATFYKFVAMRDCSSESEAFAFINYLYGGEGNLFAPPTK